MPRAQKNGGRTRMLIGSTACQLSCAGACLWGLHGCVGLSAGRSCYRPDLGRRLRLIRSVLQAYAACPDKQQLKGADEARYALIEAADQGFSGPRGPRCRRRGRITRVMTTAFFSENDFGALYIYCMSGRMQNLVKHHFLCLPIP